MTEKLDKVDLQILRTLQENARLTTKELAAQVSLSSTPVFERLKRLEREGYIKKYIAVLDADKLNQGFSYVEDCRGHAVTEISQAEVGDLITIRVTDGSLKAQIKGKEPEERSI